MDFSTIIAATTLVCLFSLVDLSSGICCLPNECALCDDCKLPSPHCGVQGLCNDDGCDCVLGCRTEQPYQLRCPCPMSSLRLRRELTKATIFETNSLAGFKGFYDFMDTTKDGKLTLEEMIAWVEDLRLEDVLSEDEYKTEFNEIDADKDGFVQINEMESSLLAKLIEDKYKTQFGEIIEAE